MKYYLNGFYENQIEGSIEITDEYWQELLNEQSQGGVIQAVDGQVVCMLPTEEQILKEQKAAKKVELQNQIDALDKKRIRAIAEPQLKDPESGQTWLEFYTLQIIDLRQQIATTI